MAVTPEASDDIRPPRRSFADTFAVYFKRRVLVIFLLGFSGGLPIVLVGSTLQAWMKQSGIDIATIGLIAAVAVPYNLKFLWAPLVDSVDVPLLSRFLGRRRSWLLFSQIWLMAAIVLLGCCDPTISMRIVAACAVFVAVASATQDIVIDAFRVESLPEDEQAAGMASYVAAYRIGSLVSGAGTLVLVADLQQHVAANSVAWGASYAVMAGLVSVGIIATLLAREPKSAVTAEAEQAASANPIYRSFWSGVDSFRDFLSRDLAITALAFVALFKLADALALSLLTPFVLDIGFSLSQVATIRNGIGFAASLLGGFAGGFIARALPLSSSLWIGGIIQAIMILAFSWQAIVGLNLAWLSVTTTIEFFADAIGTVIFVAYLSALCKNPLYTATQFALLNALAALGRNVISAGAGQLAHATGWPWFFVTCALAALPGLFLLALLQHRGHFDGLLPAGK
jgi:MFS transporter, PAT family, beta-lactamase induction signal transducer AmpG